MRGVWVLAAILGSASAMAQSTAPTPALDGTWEITGNVAGHDVISTCVLATAEGAISGTCTGVDGKVMPVKGTVKDEGITWAYSSVYEDGLIVLTYKAAFDKDGHLTGTILVDPYDALGDFTAVRHGTDAPAPTSTPTPAPTPAPAA